MLTMNDLRKSTLVLRDVSSHNSVDWVKHAACDDGDCTPLAHADVASVTSSTARKLENSKQEHDLNQFQLKLTSTNFIFISGEGWEKVLDFGSWSSTGTFFFLLSCNKSFQIQKQSNIVNFNSIVIVIQFFIGSPPFFRLFFFFSTEKTHKRAPKKPKKWIIKTKTTMTMTMKTLTLITLTTTTMITILITLNHPSTIHWRI